MRNEFTFDMNINHKNSGRPSSNTCVIEYVPEKYIHENERLRSKVYFLLDFHLKKK